MKWLILVAIALPAFAQIESEDDFRSLDETSKTHARSRSKEIGRDIDARRLVALAEKADWALANMVARGVAELRRVGRTDEADKWESEYYFHYRGFISDAIQLNNKDIGSHAGLSLYLDGLYLALEFALGKETCKALHLCDLWILSHTIPVCFNPCRFSLDGIPESMRGHEFLQHFAGDDNHNGMYGLTAVIAYWVVDIGIMAGTSGIATLLAGPVATFAEYGMYKIIAPPIGRRIFAWACTSPLS